MKTTEQTIYEMLTEGTGEALCDSGGIYGRHWERNQNKTLQDFKNEPEVKIDSRPENYPMTSDALEYEISVFHFLCNNLELNETCQAFNKINAKAKDWDAEDLFGVSKKAEQLLLEMASEIGKSFNTYNGDTFLSQVLQGNIVEINKEQYVLIQVHQGCDVRGGYTNARLFKFADPECYLIEDVYGTVGDVQIDNSYDGYSLRDENGNPVTINKVDEVSLFLPEF